ncbi:MAG: DUF502 domain-containing protein [Verrucomicrobia bacterium]|nr:DUF502 domain-containing protein [Verrucomicrobiota bacterium]
MRQSFLTGFLLLIPVAITFWIVKICFDVLSDPLLNIITPFIDVLGNEWDHPYILRFFARVSSIIILLITIVTIGFIGEHLFEGWIHRAIDSIVSRMPVIKTVHKVVKEVIKQFTSSSQSPLEKPCVIPYTSGVSYVITSQLPHMPDALKDLLPGYKPYYLPTSPQPLHGILLFSKEGKLLDANSEEMIKFIISCGVIS